MGKGKKIEFYWGEEWRAVMYHHRKYVTHTKAILAAKALKTDAKKPFSTTFTLSRSSYRTLTNVSASILLGLMLTSIPTVEALTPLYPKMYETVCNLQSSYLFTIVDNSILQGYQVDVPKGLRHNYSNRLGFVRCGYIFHCIEMDINTATISWPQYTVTKDWTTYGIKVIPYVSNPQSVSPCWTVKDYLLDADTFDLVAPMSSKQTLVSLHNIMNN